MITATMASLLLSELVTHSLLYCNTYNKKHIKIDWDPINQLNPATFLCLFQARSQISNVIYSGLLFMFNDLK